jgi:integrase
MGRPPHDVGTYGKIRTTLKSKSGEKPERWVAVARYRDVDGVTRPVERQGASATKAERALKAALKDRGPVTTLSRASRFADVAADHLDWIHRNRKGTTYDKCQWALKLHLLPAIGQLRLHEVTVVRLENLMATFQDAKLSANTRRTIRKVVSGVMQLAVSYELVDHNPARSIRNIEGPPVRKSRALDPARLAGFLAAVDADERAQALDLPDLIWFLFGTGARLGEALGLRWKDVNLTDSPVHADGEFIPAWSLWFNGNVVRVAGVGLVRHDGKTDAADRKIFLPLFVGALLAGRRPDEAELDPDSPVFPSQRGTWQWPTNVHSRFRDLRTRLEYPEFTSHVGRKTAITLLDEAGLSSRVIADLVGHAKVSTTTDVYMDRHRPSPAAAAALEAALQIKAG